MTDLDPQPVPAPAEPGVIASEPVRIGAAAGVIVSQVLNVLAVFEVIHWSLQQLGAVNIAVGAIASAVAAIWTRAKVTPV